MYRKQVRRRRAVLIGLIVLGFVLLTFTFGSGSGGVGGVLGTFFDPVTNAASRALKPARDLINWFDETMDARGERDRLQSELEEARGKAVAGEVALEDNRQLRKMVGLAEAGKIPDAYDPVTVNVTGRSPTVAATGRSTFRVLMLRRAGRTYRCLCERTTTHGITGAQGVNRSGGREWRRAGRADHGRTTVSHALDS